MTRVTVNTARCGARRVAGPLIGGLFAVLLLAGCDPASTASGDAVPGPALVQQAQTKPVAFAPVIGAPAKVSTKLNEFLVASAGQKNMPIVPPKDAEYTVRGYLVAAADPKGTKLSYIWDVSDKSNKRKRIQGDELIEGKKGGDPWAAVDEAAMKRVAAKAIDDISAYVPRGGDASAVASGGPASNPPTTTAATAAPAQPYVSSDSQAAPSGNSAVSTSGGGTVLAAQTEQPVPAPVPLPEAVALVPPVTGAPGDGSQSLTAAMRRYLQNAGVKLVDSGAGDNTYTVKGSVEIGNAVDGQQPITIQWMVVDPKGKTLDKAVVQRNKVAEGSLDGPWGQVADLAAGEAAKSISKLIGKPAS